METFHIGVASKAIKKTKKSQKNKKVIKSKKVRPYVFNSRKQNFSFNIANHYWKIPSGIKVSKSVELKFTCL